MRHTLSPTILRANDIRGTYGVDLTDADGRAIGRAYGLIAAREGARRVALARDGRVSSPALAAAVAEGMAGAGLEVLDLGLGPTPLMYFAVHRFGLDGGMMITGSHNPPDMNGMKIMLGRKSFHGERIAELGRVAADGGLAPAGAGRVVALDATAAYVDTLVDAWRPASGPGRELRCAWDPGNGATGEIVERLVVRLPGRHFVINAAIGGWYYLRIVATLYLRNALKPFPVTPRLPGVAAITVCMVLTIGLSIPPGLAWVQEAVKLAAKNVQTQRPN